MNGHGNDWKEAEFIPGRETVQNRRGTKGYRHPLFWSAGVEAKQKRREDQECAGQVVDNAMDLRRYELQRRKIAKSSCCHSCLPRAVSSPFQARANQQTSAETV